MVIIVSEHNGYLINVALITSLFSLLLCMLFFFFIKTESISSSAKSDSATPGTATHQAPLSLGFCRQEYWSGLPCLSPGDLPDPGIETQGKFFFIQNEFK